MKRETRLVPNGKEAMGTNQNHMKSHLNTGKHFFHCEVSQMLEQVARKLCGVSIQKIFIELSNLLQLILPE